MRKRKFNLSSAKWRQADLFKSIHLEMVIKQRQTVHELGGDISKDKKARSKQIFHILNKVRTLNKTVAIISLQNHSF